jgi:DNA-binding transcriptional ArsR family regulator
MFSKDKFSQSLDEQLTNTSDEDKQKMFEVMMEKCCSNLSEEKFETFKSKYMKNNETHTKTSPMMEMMSSMMKQRMKSRMGDNHPMMNMCREMMKETKSQDQDESYTTDELMDLFKDWCSHVEDEIVSFVNKSGEVNEEKIAEKFNLSKESISHLMNKLRKAGKIK